ncbi:MAG: SPOR domain-containing protein [Salaquimonas sp.]|nr:SPOR domain-containing protein [Salaquimonas sp.]
MFLKIMTVLAALCVLLVATMIFLGGDWRHIATFGTDTDDKPGVTVLKRQPFDDTAGNSVKSVVKAPVTAPIAYAVELGSATSFSQLSARFAEIARQNAEAGFENLEPRATLKETMEGLEARLLVGPFATHEDAAKACSGLSLPDGIICRTVPFEGERITRE